MLEAAATNIGLEDELIAPAVTFVPEADTVNVPEPDEGVPLVTPFSSADPL